MKTVVMWLSFVLLVSLIPLDRAPGAGLSLDLVFHFAIYAVTCMLFISVLGGGRAAARPPGRVLVASVLLAAGYGAIVEVAQAVLGTRSFSAADIAANALGALAAAGYVALRKAGR